MDGNGYVLNNFPVCLRNNINELCLNGRIGLSSITINDIAIKENNSDLHNYHFILKVPYAGKRLMWEMIFNPEDFCFAPDFDFNDECFFSDPNLDDVVENVPSLVNWDINNSTAVTNVIKDFLNLYKRTQFDQLSENIYCRYSKEYELLIKSKRFTTDQIEVSVDNNIINFLISIDVDCSYLPEYMQPCEDAKNNIYLNPGQDFVHLQITYFKIDGTKFTSVVSLSPRLDQLFKALPQLTIPDYKGDLIIGYAMTLSALFDEKIRLIADHFELKKQFILYTVAVCATSVIEYDSERFSGCSFLFETEDGYCCVVKISVGIKFPEERPAVTLYSLECQYDKCTETVQRYTYSSYYKVDEMVTHLIEGLTVAVERFKVHKH